MQVTDKIYIENCDNMLLMARYPDNHFDLAIVDPPYGIINDAKATGFKNNTFKNVKKAKNWDLKPPKKYWNELFRISKNQIIWGFQYFINELEPTKSIIIWDKMNGENFMNDCELAWSNCKGNNKLFKHAYIGRYHPEPIKVHPTQKPILLYKWLLDKYAKEGDKILDTHLGSGSIAIACHDYGFELTACELDKEYYDKAIQRIVNHTNQTKLF
jgi:site-specific DNA-methyltransferase (adenine-specific)